jgi:hypothetical protein
MEFKRLPDPHRRAETKRFFHEASLSYGTNKGGRKFWRTRKGKQASLAFWAVEEAYKDIYQEAGVQTWRKVRQSVYDHPFDAVICCIQDGGRVAPRPNVS